MHPYIPTFALFLVASANALTSPRRIRNNNHLLVHSSHGPIHQNNYYQPNPATGLIGRGEPIFYHDENYTTEKESAEKKEARYFTATGLIGKGELIFIANFTRERNGFVEEEAHHFTTTRLIGKREPNFSHDEHYMKEENPEEIEAHIMATTGLIGKGETLQVPKWLQKVFNDDDDDGDSDDGFTVDINIEEKLNLFDVENDDRNSNEDDSMFSLLQRNDLSP